MHLSGIDGLLWGTSFAGELLLIAVLFRKGLGHRFPMFTAYMMFTALSDLAGFLVLQQSSPSSNTYLYVYCASTVLDYTLQLLVLYEIGRSVLRPVQRSLPQQSTAILLVGLIGSLLVSFVLAPYFDPRSLGHIDGLTLRMTMGLALLRLLMFGVLAGFARMLGIGWKNHVLQLATGLGLYAVVTMAVQISISHPDASMSLAAYQAHFRTLTEMQSVAYIGTLAFWIWAFSQNEAPRKEFTPQMQAVLVTIAGTARRTRLAVTRSQGQK